nr:CAP domain-containing protein [Luteimicrobium subarcticum]
MRDASGPRPADTTGTWASPGGGERRAGSPIDPRAYADALVAATNDRREAVGRPALTRSGCADAAAGERAADLPSSGALEHAPLGPVTERCPPYGTAAENLSRAPADEPSSDVVSAWMASAGHRQNLLDPSLTRVGTACTLSGGQMACSEVFLGP